MRKYKKYKKYLKQTNTVIWLRGYIEKCYVIDVQKTIVSLFQYFPTKHFPNSNDFVIPYQTPSVLPHFLTINSQY